MAAEENRDLDLAAAALRADAGDLASSLEALASTLEQSLAGLASVERRRVGGLRSKRREVRRIAVALGEEMFELRREDSGVQCTRNKVVRGIVLRHDELALSQWIAELVAGVRGRAEVSERDRLALEGLLR
jgi:hypothetical protein